MNDDNKWIFLCRLRLPQFFIIIINLELFIRKHFIMNGYTNNEIAQSLIHDKL